MKVKKLHEILVRTFIIKRCSETRRYRYSLYLEFIEKALFCCSKLSSIKTGDEINLSSVPHIFNESIKPAFLTNFLLQRKILPCLLCYAPSEILDILFKYACGFFSRSPYIQVRLLRFVTKTCEKCGLTPCILSGKFV